MLHMVVHKLQHFMRLTHLCVCVCVGCGAGKFLALRLSFSLPSSCYATMLIRELTKMPTHVAFAKSLEHPK